MTMRSGLWTISLAVGTLFTLGGCGSDRPDGADTSEGTSAEAGESATEDAADETAATPDQVASVIAGQQGTWQEVIDAAADCRWSWTMGTETFAEEANALTCYVREVTMGLTATTTVHDLDALTVPASMESLVGSTMTVLDSIAAVDLEKICGEAFDLPKDTPECSEALGERNQDYRLLSTELAMWAPYL